MQSNCSLNPKGGHFAGVAARSLGRALSISAATGLLLAGALGHVPTARADVRAPLPCSNRTLRGDYGFAIDGTLFAGPAPALIRGVAMTHFDGLGNLSQVDFATRNGVPLGSDWRVGTGTYEINADCTGTATIIQDDGSPALSLRLVIVDRGRQILTIVEGAATGSLGIKVR